MPSPHIYKVKITTGRKEDGFEVSTTKFYFGRVHFKHQLTSLDDYNENITREERVRRQLWNYVNAEGPVYYEGDEAEWVFGVTERHEGLIVGQFGKIYTDKPTTYDRDTGEFVEEGEESQQADYSIFFIDPSENLIVFNQRQRIGYRQFQEAFAEGYNNHLGIDHALSIGLLQDVGDVHQLLAEAEVKYVEFTLVPTNPTSDPDMKVLDDRIQNMQADNFAMAAESDEQINMDDDLMQAALNMSTAGYGNWSMEAKRDDRREHYQSTDRPASHEITRPSSLQDLKAITGELLDRADSIIRADE